MTQIYLQNRLTDIKTNTQLPKGNVGERGKSGIWD